MGTPVVHGPVRAGGEPAVHAVTPRRFTNVLGAAADGLVHRARGRDGRERGEVVAARNRPGGELGVRAGDAGEPRGGRGGGCPAHRLKSSRGAFARHRPKPTRGRARGRAGRRGSLLRERRGGHGCEYSLPRRDVRRRVFRIASLTGCGFRFRRGRYLKRIWRSRLALGEPFAAGWHTPSDESEVDVRLTLPLARARLFRVDAPLSRGVAGARTWARRAPTRRALARCVPAAAPRASRLAPLVCTCGVFERRFAEVALNLLARVPLFPDARRSAPKPPRRALPPPLHHRRIPPCGGRGGPPPAPMRRPRCATPAASCACPSPPPGSRRRATFPSQPPRFGSVSSAFSGRLTSFLLKAETASPIRVG